MITALDGLLMAAAFLMMAAGLARQSLVRRSGGREEPRKGSLSELGKYLLSHGRILRRRDAGLAHMVVFWGVVLPFLAAVAAQFQLHFPPTAAALVSLMLDLLGAGAVAGTVFFIVRRLKQGMAEGPARTVVFMVLLLVILLTGFFSEGARLSVLETGFSWHSPVGSVLSAVLPGSPLLMQLAFRVHFFAVLALVALVPYTFGRHLVSGALNVYYRRQTVPGALKPADLQRDYAGVRQVQDYSWKQLLDVEACVACGRCEEVCPAAISGKPLSPRSVMGKIREQTKQINGSSMDASPPVLLEHAIGDGEIWSCTTCMACVEHCPVYAEPMDKIVEIRRYQVMERGRLPSEGKPTLRNLELFGDPYGRGAAHRADWATGQGAPLASSASQILLWVGCAGSFHPRSGDIALAMVKILKAAQVPFGILSKEERCCGDPARRLGEESLFLELARKNLEALRTYGAGRVVTFCPHCYNVLKNEYSALGVHLDVVHSTELVADLIRRCSITLPYPLNGKLALHDPCYLGRGNGVYASLREISRSVKGVQVVELPRNRTRALCCGGGGGLMWLHERHGSRINALRAEEIVESGARIVGTACPYCVTMLEDGLGSTDSAGPVRVLDVVEIIADSLG